MDKQKEVRPFEDIPFFYLHFDIETIPNFNLPESTKPYWEAKPSGNIKKPESIEKWYIDNAGEIENIENKKRAVNPYFLEIICLGIKVDGKKTAFSQRTLTEKEILYQFWASFEKAPCIYSFNGKGFDLPAIVHRSRIHGMKIPAKFVPRFHLGKYDSSLHRDLMLELSGGELSKAMKLEVYADLYGIPHPIETDGSQVYDLYKAGKWEEIEEYCLQDVEIVSQLAEL